MATAVDVAYHTFANDLENVNFSSIRAGVEDERDSWKVKQKDEVTDLLERSFLNWLEMALMNGALTTPNGGKLPISKAEKFAPHKFQGRTWKYINPLQDAKTNVILRDEDWKTDEEIAAENGDSEFADNVKDHERANKQRADAGLDERPEQKDTTNASQD
jgi:capsid protein